MLYTLLRGWKTTKKERIVIVIPLFSAQKPTTLRLPDLLLSHCDQFLEFLISSLTAA